MKIIGVSFGSRDGANNSICREALLAANKIGAAVSFIRLVDWNIKNCTGCVSFSRTLASEKGIGCIKKDSDTFRDALLDTDGVLFCSPIFEMRGSGLLHFLFLAFCPTLSSICKYII